MTSISRRRSAKRRTWRNDSKALAGPGQMVIDAATPPPRQTGLLFPVPGSRHSQTQRPAGGGAGIAGAGARGSSRAVRGTAWPHHDAVGWGNGTATPPLGIAKAGNGRVALIFAEPGVSKSRIAEALAERIADEPHTRLRYFCSPHHQDSALYPVIAQMERAVVFQHGDVDRAVACDDVDAGSARPARHGGAGRKRCRRFRCCYRRSWRRSDSSTACRCLSKS